MKINIIIFIALVSILSILIFFLVYYEYWQIKYLYFLPYVWLLIAFISFRLWVFNKIKLFIILHSTILLAGVFSFLTYQIFKKFSDATPISSNNFTNVSNLMFNSENALYIMIYGGVILLIVDFIYFLFVLKK